jgi:hypothetical protein
MWNEVVEVYSAGILDNVHNASDLDHGADQGHDFSCFPHLIDWPLVPSWL